ncbi:hypothetical protein A3D83_03265 [Candidatus Daviesbacteria bacterium RIFCSPHIGHO2_02_FULL_41_10]|uniref:PsbP C-terminal domain-containing protein n=2 Tax=Candidatus Daviesiibacteriota TaxID=1752718 RepID=A0A1F5IQI9_9BACT|nr:MAG: hypothetical protein A2871_03730 [Candidatus Daviesbacteria bacterium RIFCSPHIGHO2_01_FULL_41_23]OGE32568.1 MAG: hypothetical protein A3D83_03265 [Candidatus Daviesbacteria bacterium RIFCSPHIGHO2_02_FULL_41_10]OGE62349.1 MAG: hypothetical protein A2967_02745 [Candidatus Daviesbacteria bacterium RIFCSPLOWO2_01_FULL_41_32]
MQKGSALIFLLVGIVVLAAIGGAFYLGRSTTPKPSPAQVVTSQTPQPTSTPQPFSVPDETINWKTYTNNLFNFSLKYPPDLLYSSAGNDSGNSGYITFERYSKEYFTLSLSDDFAPTSAENFMGSKPLSKRIIGGKEWDYYNFYYQDKLIKSLNYNVIAFTTVNNNFLYSFVFNNQTKLTSEQDQILSTFKFTQ